MVSTAFQAHIHQNYKFFRSFYAEKAAQPQQSEQQLLCM